MGTPKPQPKRYNRIAKNVSRLPVAADIDPMLLSKGEVAVALSLASKILKDRKAMSSMRDVDYILDIVFDIYCSVSFLCEEEGNFVRKRELA